MKISKKGEYALQALTQLAIDHGKGIGATLIKDIAGRENIPPKYLEQILLTLKKAGILVSKRGAGGGYALARPPAQISLGEVIRIIEGPLAPLGCVSVRAHVPCSRESRCSLRSVMLDVRNAIAGILDNISLKELARRSKVLILVSFICLSANISFAGAEQRLEGVVTLSGAWAIYPTAVAWAEAFQKEHPKVRIDVSAGGAGKGASDTIAGLVDIGMVSREPDPAEIGKGIRVIYILHDAVFPVINEKNPALAGILKNGIGRRSWLGIYINGTMDYKLNVYTRSDSCGAAASWAAYLGKKQEDLKGIGIYGDPGLLEAVKRDVLGVGFNNFSYVFGRDGAVMPGVKIVPIDSNENGVADPDEIYTTRDAAIKAIRSARYPATRKNYFFVKGKPKGLAKEFIKFALSDEGAAIVDATGASLSLTRAEREEVLKGLE